MLLPLLLGLAVLAAPPKGKVSPPRLDARCEDIPWPSTFQAVYTQDIGPGAPFSSGQRDDLQGDVFRALIHFITADSCVRQLEYVTIDGADTTAEDVENMRHLCRYRCSGSQLRLDCGVTYPKNNPFRVAFLFYRKPGFLEEPEDRIRYYPRSRPLPSGEDEPLAPGQYPEDMEPLFPAKHRLPLREEAQGVRQAGSHPQGGLGRAHPDAMRNAAATLPRRNRPRPS